MGLEAACSATFNNRRAEGKALLETSELIFRGAFRLKIPFASVQRAEVSRGVLNVTFDGGVASFTLGKAAETWAVKIRSPKPLVEKIGVKPGMRVLVVGSRAGTGADTFWDDVRARASLVRTGHDIDVVLFVARAASDLGTLAALRERITPSGAIWVIYPKGNPSLREDAVRVAARGIGLVDVKIAGFSETFSSVKLVIPVALRPRSSLTRRERS